MGKKITDSRIVYGIVLLAISLCRLILGGVIPLRAGYSPNMPHDDYLMIQYAQLSEHFHPTNSWDTTWALTKTMSYPYFLNILMLTGIPYRFALSSLWIIGALLSVSALRRFWGNVMHHDVGWPVWSCIYTFLVFSPVAFDAATGPRIYRESILAPTVLLLVGLSGMWMMSAVDRYRSRPNALTRQLLWGFALGITWTFFWFIKESSIWLAPTFLGVLVITAVFGLMGVIRSFKQHQGNKQIVIQAVATLGVLAIPLALFAGGDAVYRSINRHYYGVPYASVRTEGEIAGFFQRLYRIKDGNKDGEHWAPWTTIEQAAQASPTLRSNTKLLHQLKVGAFAEGNWGKGPSTDMVVWAMMQDLADVGMFNDQVQPQEFFAQVNKELDEAHLPQMDGFSPTALLPRKSVHELWALRSGFGKALLTSVLWQHYSTASDISCDSSDAEMLARCRLTERTLNEPLARTNEHSMSDTRDRIGLRLDALMLNLAKCIGPITFVIGLAGILLACVMCLHKRHRTSASLRWAAWTIGLAILITGSAAALTLAVSWQYCEKPAATYGYYTGAIVPLVQVAEALGFLTLMAFVFGLKSSRKTMSDGQDTVSDQSTETDHKEESSWPAHA